MSSDLKFLAAERAADFLDGVRVLGLGTGSTSRRFVQIVAERWRDGRLEGLAAVPTSVQTERLAKRLGIPLTTLAEHPQVDLTVDGADEVSPELDLIKGLGGALTREKIVACASQRVAIIVDDSKLVEELGSRAPLPVEVVPFGWRVVERSLFDLGAAPTLRQVEGEPYVTDQSNYVLDCRFAAGIADPAALAAQLNAIPGLVCHGLFLGIADRVVVAGTDGVRVLHR